MIAIGCCIAVHDLPSQASSRYVHSVIYDCLVSLRASGYKSVRASQGLLLVRWVIAAVTVSCAVKIVVTTSVLESSLTCQCG